LLFKSEIEAQSSVKDPSRETSGGKKEEIFAKQS